jgi:hypothetical protein
LGAASATRAETLVQTGPSGERLDLVFLGDGYTAAELPLYRQDVDRFAAALFAQPPFSDYKALFNVQRVDVVSAQSGTDDDCAGVSVNTALDAGYHSTGTDCRMLFTYSAEKVFQAAAQAPGYDPGSGLVVVLVNAAKYGGAAVAGNYCVVYRGSDGPEVMSHELGHSFGLLADEYVQAGATYAGAEPPQPNVTIQTARALIKWARWIDPATPLPTSDAVDDRPGLYEGALNYQSRVFRPTYDSKMRTLYKPYDRVNAALLVDRMNALLPPTVALAAPAPGAQVSGAVNVSAQAEDGVGLSQISLLVDGRAFGAPVPVQGARAGANWTWNTGGLAQGPHSLTIRAMDSAGNQADRSEVVDVDDSGTVVARREAGPQGTVFLSPGLRDGINDTVDFGEDVVQVSVFSQEGKKVYAAEGPSAWDGQGAGSGVYVARFRRRDGTEGRRTIAVAR